MAIAGLFVGGGIAIGLFFVGFGVESGLTRIARAIKETTR